MLGVGGEPVRRVVREDLALWISAAEGATPTVEALKQHERVVREILRHATPVPFRFGTRVPAEAEAIEMLAERADQFGELIGRFRGRVEMALRVSRPGRAEAGAAPPADEEEEQAVSGREYLERRRQSLEAERAAREEAEKMLRLVEHEMEGVAEESRVQVQPGGERLGVVAHLVHADGVRSYLERVRAVQRAMPELRLVASGPWAPYSFV